MQTVCSANQVSFLAVESPLLLSVVAREDVMFPRASDAGRTTRASRGLRLSQSAKKLTPKSRRTSSPPMSARSDKSDMFSPTALVNLPSKKLSFGIPDLFPELRLPGEVAIPQASTVQQQEEPIQVHLRVRPFTSAEKQDVPPVITITGTDTVVVDPPEGTRSGERQGTYKFSRVHGPETGQVEFYEAVLKPVVTNSMAQGRHGLLFAYGMTNAGKTFTVLGTEENPGLLTRAVSDCVSAVKAANAKPRTSSIHSKVPDVFSSESDITEDMLAAATAGNGSTINQLPELLPGESLAVSLSCLEIYNDQVYDVLVPAPPEGGPPRTILKIKDGISGRVFVQGLRHVDVVTMEDCNMVIQEACRNRRVAETSLNGDSSRSHCVFGIHIWKTYPPVDLESSMGSSKRFALTAAAPAAPTRHLWSKLSVVDLAGSERQRRTANRGVRLKEAGCINNSLMSLMHCLETIRWNQKHAGAGGSARLVPFRETKLTRLFQDNLAGAGAGYTVMVLNVGPSPNDFDETVHALKYGALAKDIKIAPPKINSRWANGTFAGEGTKRRRMALIDENTESEDVMEPVVAVDPVEDNARWAAERFELQSQIEDLQALNFSMREELRQANERCSTVEMEVREEVSNEMAALMKEAEIRLREMYTKAADDRVAKLEAMYAMRQSSTVKAGVRRGSKRCPSLPIVEEGSGEDSDVNTELLSNVAECEDEIRRIKTRFAEEKRAMQAQIDELNQQLTNERIEREAPMAQFQTLVEPSTANELRPEDTIPPVSPQAIIAPPQSTAVPDAPSFTVENHVPELVEPKRRSGKSTRKVSESGRRKKSSDSAASEDCGDQENAIPVVTVSLEQKQAKRSKGSKRRSSDDIEAPTAAAVPLQEAIAPIADNCASPDEFSKTAPALTFSASKSGGIFQNVLSSAAAKVGGKLRTRMMSVINPKTSSAVAAMVTGEPTNQRPTRTKRRTVDGM